MIINRNMTPLDMIGPSMELQDKIAQLLKISKDRVQASITMKPAGTEEKPKIRVGYEVMIDNHAPQGEMLRKIDAFIKAIGYEPIE